MERTKTLADTLGIEADPRIAQINAEKEKFDTTMSQLDPQLSIPEFCQQIVATPEFRRYLLHGLVMGDLPAAITCRILDHAWGKPVERVEHSGPDGDPIVTEVRRVIVRPKQYEEDSEDDALRSQVTH